MRTRSNFWAREMRRRRFLQSGAVVAGGASTAALIGCGGDDDDTGNGNGGDPTATTPAGETEQPGGGPQAGGTFTLAMGGSPRSLDPHFDTFPYNTQITCNTNSGILRYNADLTEIQTDLAESLPEQPDEVTYTLHMRQGVRYHDVPPADGREMTAEDIKYSIERQMTDEAGVFQHAYYFLGEVDSIDVPDQYTVTIKTQAPYAPFMSYIADPWTQVINRETVEEFDDLTEHAIGTGPYILDEWRKEVDFTLRKNPDYWDQPLPYLDGLRVVIAPDPETMTTLFAEGEVDACALGINQRDRAQDARPDANYEAFPSQFWKIFRMPPTTPDDPYEAPFDQLAFRQAIASAINPDEVLDLVYSGDGIRAPGPVLPIYTEWALPEGEDPLPFDLERARSLMDQAGIDSFSGPLIWASTSTEQDQVAEIIARQLAEINVTAELSPMELAQYYNQTYSYEYTFSHHTPLNAADPDENLSSYYGPNATYYKYHNEDVWDVIQQQRRELDIETRKELVLDASRMVIEQAPVRFMYTTNLHRFVGKQIMDWKYPVNLYDGRIYGAWIDQNA